MPRRLFAIIDQLGRRGLAIVYISHFLEEVRTVAQTYTVLRGRPRRRRGTARRDDSR